MKRRRLKQPKDGNPPSQNFFIHSGEEGEELRGKPEALIVFTSKEVIKGQAQRDVRDHLFGTRKQKSACKTISKYISNMAEFLRLPEIECLYAIEVNIGGANQINLLPSPP